MDFKDFKWTVETKHKITETGIEITPIPGRDYFVNPITDEVTVDSAYFYKEVEGDFVIRAKVSHDCMSTYDACVLMAYDNDRLWAKACFEKSDFNTNAVVTVMTNGRSDDANGVNIDGKEVWLQLARKGNVFAVHYSLDGEEFIMSRLCHLPMQDKIRVGISGQCPVGDTLMKNLGLESFDIEELSKNVGVDSFEFLSLEKYTLSDIRNGNK
ncbi:MAG TPA: DUF1349 domain-containing protein [Clostridiales bacterium]|nr:DUF1349 domain-containing protein [Clostridiales bacterium]